MESQIITLSTASGNDTTVKVIRETAKAIQVEGNCSKAWFPKSAISESGRVAGWFTFGLEHSFLWEAPYDAEKRIQHGVPL